MGPLRAGLVLLAAVGMAGCATYTRTRNVVFTPPGWPEAVKADLYVPKGQGPFPGVLLIHGGAWSHRDNRWQMLGIARHLAERGYVVLNANYRGLPEWRYPAPVEDLKEAAKWLRTHAGENRMDPRRMATYGYSAGGHLAALIGFREHFQAVVAGAAPTDLEFGGGGPIVEAFLGGTIQEIPQVYHEASPLFDVTARTPPVFQFQGTKDHTVSVEHTRMLHAALDAAGVKNEVRWVEGRTHVTAFLFSDGAKAAAIDFLDRTLR